MIIYILLGFGSTCLCFKFSRNNTICSPWSDFDPVRNICACPDAIYGILQCNESGYIDAIRDCACITFDAARHTIEVGFCIYGCGRQSKSNYSVPAGYSALTSNISQWNKSFCGPFKREGTLCGACQNNSYAPVYSYDMKCVECHNNWDNLWKYLLWAFGPLTLFYFIFLSVPVNIVSSRLMGFVFYSQIITLPALIRPLLINKQDKPYIAYPERFLAAFYGIWNLDYFRTYNSGICLQTDTLATLTLELAIAAYPLLLMIITYLIIMAHDNDFRPLIVLMKPILHVLRLLKSNWNIKTSTIDSFVTFTLLSNVKLLGLCIDLLTPITVYQFRTLRNISFSRRLYYDSTVEYFGPKHLPYAVLAIAVLLISTVLPIVLLAPYPFRAVQKCINLLPSRSQLFLNTFVDSFQGCYKNGTEPGTRDYRYLSVLQFVIRLIVVVAYIRILNAVSIPFVGILLVMAAALIISVDPFKKEFQYISYYWLIHLLLLTCLSVGYVSLNDDKLYYAHENHLITIFFAVSGLVLVVPMLYSSLALLYFIFFKIKKLFLGV